MKRFFALFVVLIFMVSAMCLPVFAADLLAVSADDEFVVLKDSWLYAFDGGFMDNSAPINLIEGKTYEITTDGDSFFAVCKKTEHSSQICYYLGNFDLFISDYQLGTDDDFFCADVYDYGEFNKAIAFDSHGGSTFIISEVVDSVPVSSVSSVVTADMLSGVLSQIVALLPVVVGCIVAFVGIRKGISFLQQIMHSA